LTEEYRFFHWELEFPDVFNTHRSGFSAMIGNPPWENLQPNPKEFFSNIDPLFKTLGRLESNQWQEKTFKHSEQVEEDWLYYSVRFKALSNWVQNAADPCGVGLHDRERKFKGIPKRLSQTWKERILKWRGYADPEHPYQLQKGRIFTYRLFLETSIRLLRENGYVGMILPSSLYTDSWAQPLREFLLERCSWKWLFGFINWNKIFTSIYYRFKFGIVIVKKGGKTKRIRAAFSRYHLEEWEEAEKHVLEYPADRVSQFSPESKVILEIRTEKDLEILTKLYKNGVFLGDKSENRWGIKYRLEFMMNTDAHLFPPRALWEDKGYKPDEYGHWLKGNWQDYDGPKSILKRKHGFVLSQDGQQALHVDQMEDVALPLYEGRMIGQFDFSEKGWVSGRGRSAVWNEIPFDNKILKPQYVMSLNDYENSDVFRGQKIGFLAVGSATNARSMVCSLVDDSPCGNSVAILQPQQDISQKLGLIGFLNSFSYDFALRCRLGGVNLNYFVVEETPVLQPHIVNQIPEFSQIVASLCCPHERFAGFWKYLSPTRAAVEIKAWRELWAASPLERQRLRAILEATCACLLRLSGDEFGWVLRDCDRSRVDVNSSEFMRKSDPKGFWRVDKDKDPELRHTVLSLVAFHDLKEKGLDEFLNQNEGEGWMIPDKLRLANYGLGHDDRAKEYQPVASRLGPRFYDWQLAQSVEESWEECEAHAELIQKIVPPPPEEETSEEAPDEKEVAKDLFGDPLKTDLFGNVVYPKSRKR
ncbi:hypothetical protein MYX82_13885, partial [Acidobacteria bacterium AH-259-D05]|nr:hypothetical protein [Acidobacteria bacterium AH-259-D05]